MGVTAHFFAFDPWAAAAPPGIRRWRDAGALDDALEVRASASAWLREIDTPLAANKRWYDNLAGDFAWTCARRHVEPAARAAIDAWLSHLFWQGEEGACGCGRAPVRVAEDEVVYDDALLAHILGCACSLAPAEAGLAIEFGGDPPRSPRLDRPWIYDFENFVALADEWRSIFAAARRAGPGWSLLRWVWI